MSETNRDVAIRIQEKFHFYLVGLSFTVLALSIQTVESDRVLVSDISELVGWVLLLISGLAGLARLESVPRAYLAADRQEDLSALKNELVEAGIANRPVRAWGQPEATPVENLVRKAEEQLVPVSARVGSINKRLVRMYKIHKYTLVLALAALIVARGYQPIKGVIVQLSQVFSWLH